MVRVVAFAESWCVYSEEFRHRLQLNSCEFRSIPPPIPVQRRQCFRSASATTSTRGSARHLRRVVHGGGRASLATYERLPGWATRVQRPRCVCVPSPAQSASSQARSMSAMCCIAGVCVAIPIRLSRPLPVCRGGRLWSNSALNRPGPDRSCDRK